MRESREEQEGGQLLGGSDTLDSLENVYKLAKIEGAFEKVGFKKKKKIVKVFQSTI